MLTPYDLNKNEWDNLCYALGTIVVAWSLVEQPLDFCVAIIYHNCGGKDISEKYKNEVPRSMNVKIKLLKRYFKKLDILSPYKDVALNILKVSNEFAIIRNDIIHMRLMGRNHDGSYLFDKIEYRAKHKSRLITYSITQLQEVGKEIQSLAINIVSLCQVLQEKFAPKELCQR